MQQFDRVNLETQYTREIPKKNTSTELVYISTQHQEVLHYER